MSLLNLYLKLGASLVSALSQKAHNRALVWQELPVVSRWSNIGLALAGGRGILLSPLTQKVHNVSAFLPRRFVHNQIFNPLFRPALGLRPCRGLL